MGVRRRQHKVVLWVETNDLAFKADVRHLVEQMLDRTTRKQLDNAGIKWINVEGELGK